MEPYNQSHIFGDIALLLPTSGIDVFSLTSSNIGLIIKPDPKLALLGIGLDSWPPKFHTILTPI